MSKSEMNVPEFLHPDTWAGPGPVADKYGVGNADAWYGSEGSKNHPVKGHPRSVLAKNHGTRLLPSGPRLQEVLLQDDDALAGYEALEAQAQRSGNPITGLVALAGIVRCGPLPFKLTKADSERHDRQGDYWSAIAQSSSFQQELHDRWYETTTPIGIAVTTGVVRRQVEIHEIGPFTPLSNQALYIQETLARHANQVNRT